MAISKHMQGTIKKWVEVYLNELEKHRGDLGWRNSGVFGKIIDFQGDLPPPSGMDTSNDKMISEIEFHSKPHALFPSTRFIFGWAHTCHDCGKAWPVIDEHGKQQMIVPDTCPTCRGKKFILLEGQLPEHYSLALLAHGMYEPKNYNATQIADLLGLTYGEYTGNLERGREKMGWWINVVLELMRVNKRELETDFV